MSRARVGRAEHESRARHDVKHALHGTEEGGGDPFDGWCLYTYIPSDTLSSILKGFEC